MKILITGVSGTGKTTILVELQKLGYLAIDLDATGLCQWKNKTTEESTEYGISGRDQAWLEEHGWYCDNDKLKTLLSTIREDKKVFVAGIAENIETIANNFDKVLILTSEDEVIKDRLTKRSNNHFGKKVEEQDFILKKSKEILEQLGEYKVIDTSKSPTEIAEIIINSLDE